QFSVRIGGGAINRRQSQQPLLRQQQGLASDTAPLLPPVCLESWPGVFRGTLLESQQRERANPYRACRQGDEMPQSKRASPRGTSGSLDLWPGLPRTPVAGAMIGFPQYTRSQEFQALCRS